MKMKVATRNNLLKKLSTSKWGTNSSTIKSTALALLGACPVWEISAHAYILDHELNKAYREIAGCLKA